MKKVCVTRAKTGSLWEIYMIKFFGFVVLCLMFVLNSPFLLASEDHNDGEAGREESDIVLSSGQRKAAGVVIDKVLPHALTETLRVPAEVVVNAYQSARVTPRIQAQVLARHVRLGDYVEADQPLVTLSSVAMAEAQGALIVADREWQRVKKLGRKAVAERRYTETQVARQQAFAKVLAYGMQDVQAVELLRSGNAANATGEFDLLAPIAGTVLQDAFIVGELIEPGRVLFDISDETILWVEARVIPSTLSSIEIGAPARVSANGTDWIEGRVIQLHHQLNETTRTQGIRIAVENSSDQIHPGQFAEAELVTGPRSPVLAIPNESVTLIKGNPTVFKFEDGNRFRAAIVEPGSSIGGWTEIHAGLEEGEEIAISGVFYLKSLLLKSTLGEGDAH